MNVTIVGAGAMGCYLGARLQESGHNLEYVGRADQVATLSSTGLKIIQAERPGRILPVRATLVPQQRPDLVLLTVKSQDVESACQVLRGF
jgi:2-dehydropantoate 2-reductase